MDTGLIDCKDGALVLGGAGAASYASTASAISVIQPDIEVGWVEGLSEVIPWRALETRCVKAHNR